LRVGILNDDNKEEIKEVAILAAKCFGYGVGRYENRGKTS
ncbi:hypothetical protein A2U01_0071658, partial [Trifolium medium]|nr:hypothetical protein [Trifolium medium]